MQMTILEHIKDILSSLYQELVIARDGPTFREVRERIAEGRHTLVPALKQISWLSTSIDKSPETIIEIEIITEHGRQMIPVANWALTFVAKEILYVSNPEFEKPISNGLLTFYSNWYTNIRDPRSFIAAFSKAKRRRRAQSILIRMDYEQIALQGLSPIAELARTLILYDEPLYDGSGNLLYNPQVEFQSIANLNLIDFMAIGFAAHARVQQHHDPCFAKSNLIPNANNKGPLTSEKVTKFVALVASDYHKFRQSVDEEESSLPGFEKYALNPLYRTPIIKTHIASDLGEPVLIAPIPLILLYRVTHGIYWDLLSKWSDDVEKLGRSRAPDFPSFFGQTFERYVGQLLSEVLPAGSVHPQQKYGPRSRVRDSCDWIVTEGDTAILIECKTSRFHHATKATGDPEDFLSESEAIYGKALIQILQTKRAIQNGELSLPNSPSEFLGLIVIFDHLLMASLHLRDDLIGIVPSIDSSFSSEDVMDLDFRILPIRMLENFTPRAVSSGLSSVFEADNWNSLPRGGRNLPAFLRNKFKEFEEHIKQSFLP